MDETIAHSLARGPVARTFLDGSEYRVIELPSVRLGLGHFRPGWRWSKHAGAQTGKASMAHIGYVLSGSMMVRSADGRSVELGPGDAFEVGPDHDAWVIGDETCVALDVATKTAG